MTFPAPAVQRTPIDPSRVVCLGPLPENLTFARVRPPIPRIVAPAPPSPSAAEQGQAFLQAQNLPLPHSPRHQRSPTQGSTSTLGSNYTVEETSRLQAEGAVIQPTVVVADERNSESSQENEMPRSPARIETGAELIHVPQVAEKRYSWEDDRRGSV
jgi:hypothetical protein